MVVWEVTRSPGRTPVDPLADGGDLAGRLVPDDHRGGHGVLVVLDVQVGAGDAGGGDADDDLARAGDRLRNLPQLEVPLPRGDSSSVLAWQGCSWGLRPGAYHSKAGGAVAGATVCVADAAGPGAASTIAVRSGGR